MRLSALNRPLWRTVSPDAIRVPRRPGSGGPSNTISIRTLGGTTARSRPIRVAAGAGDAAGPPRPRPSA